MGPKTINGIPAHPLWVHAVVILVPLSALVLVLCAVWPAVMRRAGIALPLLSLAALVSVPLATQAGEWLQEQVPETAAVERHTEMGDGLLPWSIGVFAVSVVLWVAHRGLLRRLVPARADRNGVWRQRLASRPTALRAAAAVLALLVGAGAVVQVYRIGDSGAKAVWQGR